MPEFRTEPMLVPYPSGLLPEGERDRRVALTSFNNRGKRAQVPGREVVCYECGRRSHVPAAALSASCIHCHAHLRMADIELKPGSQRLTVRTLGNVTVQADAVLSHLSIVCHNLYLLGRASGNFRCSGTLQIACNTRIEGSVQAGKLLVDKAVDVVLVQGASVASMEVSGRVSGRIDATDTVILRRGGELFGDCYAPRMEVEPGAVHRGRWEKTEARTGVQ